MSDDPKGRLPGPEEPAASAEELEEARAFGAQVDRALAGERVSAEETLAAALMVHASAHEPRLASGRRVALVDEALAGAAVAPARRRPAVMRWAPALALAASFLLLLGSLVTLLAPRRRAPARRLPSATLSRSSDALMGRPFRDRAGASRRLDLVFADRLSGYRQVRFGERSGR
jgi:hypothetical protein